ncbi:MAG: GNAT family N-acetyltransferase [Oscillospiraceae bacterium]|nr:GNAT family N-acetyltransferase [Oscillospiraceae bacterium]
MIFLDTSDLRDDILFLKLTGTAQEKPEKDLVPAYYFDIILQSGERVGTCDLRVGNSKRIQIGGNIGYTVFPSFRGNHYAGRAVVLLKSLARRHGMTELRITCDPENRASAKTCEWAGGTFTQVLEIPADSDMYERGRRSVQVYVFPL